MMKASELIEALQDMILKHGDLPIEAFNAAGNLGEPEPSFVPDRNSEPKPLFVIES